MTVRPVPAPRRRLRDLPRQLRRGLPRALLCVLALAAASRPVAAQDEDGPDADGAVTVGGIYWPQGEPPTPEALREHPEAWAALLEEEGLALDLEHGTVTARGGSLHDVESLGYPIEYVLVTDRGRTHEALFVMKARPSVLDACLRALGLAPGSPMRFRLRDEPLTAPGGAGGAGGAGAPGADGAGEHEGEAGGDAEGGVGGDVEDDEHGGDPPWEAVPAYGPLVAIDVAWTDDAGRPHTRSLESMLLDVRTGEALPEQDWVYVGGRYGPLRQGREMVQVHVADLNGNVVAIYLDGQGLCLFERNSLEGVDDSLYTIHPEHAPKRGTPVSLVFAPTGRAVPAPPPVQDEIVDGELAAGLDAALQAAAAQGFGGVVQVERGGQTLLRKAYGTLTPAGGAMPADAVFPLGTAGRRMVAAAVLGAQEARVLSLDDLLARHVHGVPEDKAGVRLRHLLEDSSGLPPRVAGAETIDRTRALQALLAEPLRSAPGEACVPSEAGYALLLIALENAAEDVWRGYLGEHVLAPARMLDAGLWGEPRWDGARLAHGTLSRDGKPADAGTPAERLPTWLEQGGGAMIGSVRDLVRFERALALGLLPSAARTFAPACSPVGGAWRVEVGPAGRCVVLAGAPAGFRCSVRSWLDRDLTLVVLANVVEPDVEPLLVALIERTLGAPDEAAPGDDGPR